MGLVGSAEVDMVELLIAVREPSDGRWKAPARGHPRVAELQTCQNRLESVRIAVEVSSFIRSSEDDDGSRDT